ncbi:MAG TPA: glycosyltransferase [Candidatus Moranbacteria bacterium]|nr:glycosyltransferase [Candidatus Moranbacteria bacterium]HQB59523.1 glycosyltransferase [Candidatus Moranbacteria bacterium]
MRILLISDHADPLAEIGSKEAGGQNIYVFYLARFLSRLGIYVDVYTRWDRKNKKEVIKINSHFRVIRVEAGPKRYIPRDNFLDVLDEFVKNILKRVKKEKINYDIIHSNYWFSGLAGLKIKKKIKKHLPLVHVYHSIGQVRFNALKNYKLQDVNNELFKIREKSEKEIAQNADAIVATSPVDKNNISKFFKIGKEKIKVITIGIDKKIFRPINEKRAKKLVRFRGEAKNILYVGRIEWRKGIGTLIYALKKIVKYYPNTKLYVIGGGKSKSARKLEEAELERLQKIAAELQVENNIIFLGAKKQKHLCRYYSASDVCVVPSYYEPFGIVPVESMACGTPVIASRTGGLKYSVIDGKTGYLAEPRNYNDLANKIIEVLKKGKDFYKSNCLERIDKNFIWEKIAKKYQTYFNQLIEKDK